MLLKWYKNLKKETKILQHLHTCFKIHFLFSFKVHFLLTKVCNCLTLLCDMQFTAWHFNIFGDVVFYFYFIMIANVYDYLVFYCIFLQNIVISFITFFCKRLSSVQPLYHPFSCYLYFQLLPVLLRTVCAAGPSPPTTLWTGRPTTGRPPATTPGRTLTTPLSVLRVSVHISY